MCWITNSCHDFLLTDTSMELKITNKNKNRNRKEKTFRFRAICLSVFHDAAGLSQTWWKVISILQIHSDIHLFVIRNINLLWMFNKNVFIFCCTQFGYFFFSFFSKYVYIRLHSILDTSQAGIWTQDISVALTTRPMLLETNNQSDEQTVHMK